MGLPLLFVDAHDSILFTPVSLPKLLDQYHFNIGGYLWINPVIGLNGGGRYGLANFTNECRYLCQRFETKMG